MDDLKSFLRHEVLNVITQLLFLVDDLDINTEDKKALIKRLELLTFLGAEEVAILTNKKDFHKTELDLGELLLMIRDILEGENKDFVAQLKCPEKSMSVTADYECTKNTLKVLLRFLLRSGSKVQLQLNPENQSLAIESGGFLNFSLTDLSLVDLIKKEKDSEMMLLQAHLKLLAMSGVDIKIEEKKMVMGF